MNKYEENAFDEFIKDILHSPNRKTKFYEELGTNLVVVPIMDVTKSLREFQDKIESQENQ